MDKNLLGENIPQKSIAKKGVEKTIFFAKITYRGFAQMGEFGERDNSFYGVLSKSFNKQNANYNSKEDAYLFSCDNQNYKIKIIEGNKEYYFGLISSEKEYNDCFEEYKDKKKGETIKEIIIKSFTFFYIDIKKQSLVYIGQKGVKNLNKVFTKYFSEQAQANVIINYLGNKKILESVQKANKLKTFSFNVADRGDIRKSLDQTLSWTRDVDSFLIKITIKNPSVKYLEQILNDNGKCNKIIKPVLSFQDEYFNDAIANIFEESFSIKESIEMKEIDLKNYGSIKNKLVNAMNRYMR